MDWLFKRGHLGPGPMPKDVFGFIYEVTFTDGKKYLGKKQVWMQRKLKPRKTDRVNARRIKFYEAKWREYEGSSQHRGDREVASKEILQFCYSKKELTYEEEKILFVRDVLFDESYLNANIRGVYFRKDFE